MLYNTYIDQFCIKDEFYNTVWDWRGLGVVWIMFTNPLTAPINRLLGDHPKGRTIHLLLNTRALEPSYFHHTHLHSFHSRVRESRPSDLTPNIWCLPCSKPENNPDDATQKTKPTSLTTGRRNLTPNLRPKPTTYPKSPKYHRGLGACNL
jgi:hypothetical protein